MNEKNKRGVCLHTTSLYFYSCNLAFSQIARAESLYKATDSHKVAWVELHLAEKVCKINIDIFFTK